MYTSKLLQHIDIVEHNISHRKQEMDLAIEGIIDEYLRVNGEGSDTNLRTVFATDYYVHHRNPKFAPIIEIVTDYVNEYQRQIFKAYANLGVYNCWGALYEENDSCLSHDHFPAAVSTVLYLQIENRNTVAPLVFTDSNYTINPYNGLLVMFPGVMNHFVPPTKSKRIVLSMNFSIVPEIVMEDDINVQSKT